MKKKRKCYYDGYYNSDKADVESDSSDYNDNNNESKNEEIKVRKKKNIKIKKNLKYLPPKKQRKSKSVL